MAKAANRVTATVSAILSHRQAGGGARRRPGRAAQVTQLGVLAVAVVAAAWAAGCVTQENTTFDPRKVDAGERLATKAPWPRLTTIPTTLQATPLIKREVTAVPATFPTTGQSVPDEDVRRLTLREILLRSVANSGAVRVAGYDPAINAMRVIEAEAQFDPQVIFNSTFARTGNQTAGQVIPDPTNPFSTIVIDKDRSDITTNEFGVQQNLPSGGKVKASYQLTNNYFNPRRFQLNPFWENVLKLEVTQPLLRQFGSEVNSARIRIARNDQRISVLDFRKALEENLAQLEQDYWQLYQAETEVRIQEELLLQTIQTYTTVYQRAVTGMDASFIPVRQAEGQVHARKANLIESKRRVRDVSHDIKRRMGDPEFPVSSFVVILPATPPLVAPLNFDPQEQVQSGLDNRFELGQQKLRIDSADVALQVARNGLLPQLDLVLSAGFNGVGKNESDAASSQADFNHFSGSVGIQFAYPLGNREARSVYRRAQLQRLQAVEQYKDLKDQVTLEIMVAMDEIWSNWDQVRAFQQSRLAFAEQLRLYQRQEDIGGKPLTPEFLNVKLQAQSDLANARTQEASAIAGYNTALQRLERAKGTLLRYDNIKLEEDREMYQLPPR